MSFAQALEDLLVGKGDRSRLSPVDVVVAIGETLAPDLYQPSPQTRKVAEVVAFYLGQKLAPAVALIGRGYPQKVKVGRSEAAAMREIVASEVDLSKLALVVEEEKSHDTRANAEALKTIMDGHGWKSAIVVAQQLHAKRVQAVCRKLLPEAEGYNIRVIPAWSEYGGSSKWIFKSFWTFFLWDRVIAWTVFWLKGWV